MAWAQVLNSLAGNPSWSSKPCRSNKVEKLFQTRRNVESKSSLKITELADQSVYSSKLKFHCGYNVQLSVVTQWRL